MVKHTPTDASAEQLYECGSCLHRTAASSRPSGCPACGDTLHNIGVPRE